MESFHSLPSSTGTEEDVDVSLKSTLKAAKAVAWLAWGKMVDYG